MLTAPGTRALLWTTKTGEDRHRSREGSPRRRAGAVPAPRVPGAAGAAGPWIRLAHGIRRWPWRPARHGPHAGRLPRQGRRRWCCQASATQQRGKHCPPCCCSVGMVPDCGRATFISAACAQRCSVDEETGEVIVRLGRTDIVKVSPTGEVTLNSGDSSGVRLPSLLRGPRAAGIMCKGTLTSAAACCRRRCLRR